MDWRQSHDTYSPKAITSLDIKLSGSNLLISTLMLMMFRKMILAQKLEWCDSIVSIFFWFYLILAQVSYSHELLTWIGKKHELNSTLSLFFVVSSLTTWSHLSLYEDHGGKWDKRILLPMLCSLVKYVARTCFKVWSMYNKELGRFSFAVLGLSFG